MPPQVRSDLEPEQNGVVPTLQWMVPHKGPADYRAGPSLLLLGASTCEDPSADLASQLVKDADAIL